MIEDHVKLRTDDECYFWREYTSQKNYKFSSANQLISNLKKKPSKPPAELKYKRLAIGECAKFYSTAIRPEWLATATLVPIPCSKARGHPDFDERMLKVCQGIRPGLDVRELVTQTVSLGAFHECDGRRPTVEDLLNVYCINDACADPSPTRIAIFDDLLTVGVHFKAMQTILRQKFGAIEIVGFFVARRIFSDQLADFVSFDDDP